MSQWIKDDQLPLKRAEFTVHVVLKTSTQKDISVHACKYMQGYVIKILN